MNEKRDEILLEATKQVAKNTYDDGVKPIVKPTGETIGLVPRAIKAALLPLEKWILNREYSLNETKKILDKKLENVDPSLIETPEPYIAVPALQYISYCMDSEELRDMYANLLANSMNIVVKDKVHPGFIEIIKQLSPDEAKIVKDISTKGMLPFIKIRYENEKGEGHDVKNKFSNIGEIAKCEFPMEIEKYLDNLERLGIIMSSTERYLIENNIYEKLENHDYINRLKDIPQSKMKQGYTKFKVDKGYFGLTEFGKSFCRICVI